MTDALPHNDEAERTCLGAALRDGGAMPILSDLLQPTSFYRDAHRQVYSAMLSLHDRGEVPDEMSVASEMGDALEDLGGKPWLFELTFGLPRITNLEQWARIILEHSWRRQLIRLGSALADRAGKPEKEVHELIEGMTHALSKISSETGGSVVRLRDVIPASVLQIETFVQSRGKVGISTGWEEVDRAIGGGWCPGRIYFLGARSSRGKTAQVIQWVGEAAKSGAKCLVFSTEMIPEDIGERILCHQGETDKWAIFKNENNWEKITRAAGVVRDWPIWIDRRPSPTIGQVEATCRQFKLREGLDFVVVDHLQRMKMEGRGDNRWLDLGLAVQGLKSLSMRLGIPVLVTSQISGEKDGDMHAENHSRAGVDKEPHCSSLAQSRQMIESEADVIGFLTPTSAYWRDELETNLRFYLEKSRHGRNGASWDLSWNKPTHTMKLVGRTVR
jgi:replicative DNA helicase